MTYSRARLGVCIVLQLTIHLRTLTYGRADRRGDGAFFFISPGMNIVVVCATVGQAVNQPGVGMKGEYHRLVAGEQFVELRIAQAMRMLALPTTLT